MFGCLPLDQCIDCLTYLVWHFLSVMSRLFPSCLVIVMSFVFLQFPQSMFLPFQPDYLEILVLKTRKEVACPPLTITLTDRTCDSFCTSLSEWIKRDLESDDKEKRRGMRGTLRIFLLPLTRLLLSTRLLPSFPFLPIEGKEAVVLKRSFPSRLVFQSFFSSSWSSVVSLPVPLLLSLISLVFLLSLPFSRSLFYSSHTVFTHLPLLDSTSNGWCSHFGLSQLHPSSCSFLLCLFFMYPYSILQVFLFCLFLLFSSQGIRDPSLFLSLSFLLFHSASIRQQTTSGMK